MSQVKIISTINQNRIVKSAINPTATQRDSNVISTAKIYVRERPIKISTQEITDLDGFILDSGISGVLDEDVLGLLSTTDVVLRVSNTNNLFVETFDYDEFSGTNTTCTFNTTDGQAEFTSGEILEIVSAFKDSSGTQVISSATPYVTEGSGSFTYEVSADGGLTWDTVSNGETATFPRVGQTYDNPLYTYDSMLYDQTTLGAGSDLRFRATESDGSTGTITLLKTKYTLI